MRLILRLVLLLPAITLAALGLLAVLALDDQPLVTHAAPLSPEELNRAERVLREHDPRRQSEPGDRTLSLSAQDVNALAGYLGQHVGMAAMRATLGTGEVRLAGSRELPENPVGRFLNVEATLRPRGTELSLGDLRVGRVPVPDTLAAWAWRRTWERLAKEPGFLVARESIREVQVAPDTLRIRYEWRPELLGAARDQLVPPADRERLAAFQRRLLATLASVPAGRSLPLAGALRDLARTDEPTGDDAPAENRALLVVLAAHALGKDLRLLAPDAEAAPRRGARLVLRGRADLAQHFLASAAVAAASGSAVSEALGLSKELADARSGSGFSFTDLAADRAGTRFGELAVRSPDAARAWRARLAAEATEADFMPVVDGLPEYLSESELRHRYGEVGSPAYQEVLDDVDRRVSACPMYRP
jgi:uncharacterized protein YfiM (DUF2279 family)